MDLNGATWMVRQLEQSVSMVHLDEHHGVFAGGWDGRLTHWDEAGEHVWTAQTNDRISALALNEDLAVVASGLLRLEGTLKAAHARVSCLQIARAIAIKASLLHTLLSGGYFFR